VWAQQAVQAGHLLLVANVGKLALKGLCVRGRAVTDLLSKAALCSQLLKCSARLGNKNK